MNTGIILSLVLGGLLAVIPAGILWLLDRSRLMTFGIAIVQMGVQLLLPVQSFTRLRCSATAPQTAKAKKSCKTTALNLIILLNLYASRHLGIV